MGAKMSGVSKHRQLRKLKSAKRSIRPKRLPAWVNQAEQDFRKEFARRAVKKDQLAVWVDEKAKGHSTTDIDIFVREVEVWRVMHEWGRRASRVAVRAR